MGASSWDYYVPYQPDLAQALAALRQQIFAEHDYALTLDDDESWPATMQELFAREDVGYGGTHSILDIDRVIGPHDEDGFGTLRPLTEAELVRYLGTTTPTRADFDRAYALEGADVQFDLGQRWSGYAAVLYDGGNPAQIAIWGYSGD